MEQQLTNAVGPCNCLLRRLLQHRSPGYANIQWLLDAPGTSGLGNEAVSKSKEIRLQRVN